MYTATFLLGILTGELIMVIAIAIGKSIDRWLQHNE